MSFDEDAAKVRAEVIQKITVGVGIMALGLKGVGEMCQRLAEMMEGITEKLVSDAVDEEFADDLAEREEDEDAKDVEDDQAEEVQEPSWVDPQAQYQTPPAPDPVAVYDPPRLDPLT